MNSNTNYNLLTGRRNPLGNQLVEPIGPPPVLGLLDYIAILRSQIRVALIISATFACCGLLLAFVKSPVFESSMLIQIGPSFLPGVGGLTADRTKQDFYTTAAAEAELIKSRKVIGETVNELSLNVTARPNYFPLIGRAFAATSSGNRVSLVPGFREYCWGGESITVKRLNVPVSLIGQKLKISLHGSGLYALEMPEGNGKFFGSVGKTERFITKMGEISLFIESVAGLRGQSFWVVRNSDGAVIDEILKSLTAGETSKASNILKVGFRSNSAAGAYTFLTSLARHYLANNSGVRNSDVLRTAAIADAELPEVKARMEEIEKKYSRARRKYGAANIRDIGLLASQKLSVLNDRKSKLLRKRLDASSRFGILHPVIKSLDEQINLLNFEISKADAEVSSIPAIEAELQDLARESKINSDLYTSLLRSSKELELSTRDLSSNIKIADAPVVPTDRSDSPSRLFFICFGIGIISGVSLAILAGLAKRSRPQSLR